MVSVAVDRESETHQTTATPSDFSRCYLATERCHTGWIFGHGADWHERCPVGLDVMSQTVMIRLLASDSPDLDLHIAGPPRANDFYWLFELRPHAFDRGFIGRIDSPFGVLNPSHSNALAHLLLLARQS
jgi:hypothetical protein